MKTYWKRNGIIYIYTNNSKPCGTGWQQVTKNDYVQALNDAWTKRKGQEK